MKVLHFIPSSPFTRLQQSLYEEAFPGCNMWFVMSKWNNKEVNFDQAIPFQIIDQYIISDDIIDHISANDCIVFHYFIPLYQKILLLIPGSKLIVWHSWGADYYHYLEPIVGNIHMPFTRILKVFIPDIKVLIKNILTLNHLSIIKKAIPFEKIDVISIQPELYPLLKKAIPNLRAKQHYLNSYTLEDTFNKGPEAFCGPGILIGNSATSTNNHLDIFIKLYKLNLGGRELILPLNYGNLVYGRCICLIAKILFRKSKVVPIFKFRSIEDYYEIIKNCGIVIMNHKRQQARGNINTAIYKGAKVFLRPDNPIYKQYKKLGFHLFSIGDLFDQYPNSLEKLSESQKLENKRNVELYWSREVSIQKIKELETFYAEKSTANSFE